MSINAADFTLKTVPGVRLVAVTDTLAPDEFGHRIGPMFSEVADALQHAKGSLETPVATYSWGEHGTEVVVGYESDSPAPEGTEIVELAPATVVFGTHFGSMETIQDSWMQLMSWAGAQGYEFTAPCREIYLEARSPDQGDWVTELQQPVAPKA